MLNHHGHQTDFLDSTGVRTKVEENYALMYVIVGAYHPKLPQLPPQTTWFMTCSPLRIHKPGLTLILQVKTWTLRAHKSLPKVKGKLMNLLALEHGVLDPRPRFFGYHYWTRVSVPHVQDHWAALTSRRENQAGVVSLWSLGYLPVTRGQHWLDTAGGRAQEITGFSGPVSQGTPLLEEEAWSEGIKTKQRPEGPF